MTISPFGTPITVPSILLEEAGRDSFVFFEQSRRGKHSLEFAEAVEGFLCQKLMGMDERLDESGEPAVGAAYAKELKERVETFDPKAPAKPPYHPIVEQDGLSGRARAAVSKVGRQRSLD